MKIISKITFTIALSLFFLGCSKEDNFDKLESSNKFGNITITKKIDNNLLNSVYNYNSKTLKNVSSKNTFEIDFNNPSLISIDNSNISAISLPEINNLNSNLKREKSFIIDQNREIVKYIITEINYISDTKNEVKYFSEKGVLINHFIINSQNDTVEFLLNTASNSNYLAQQRGCGQEVIDCMGDKYANNGWDSVFLSIASAVYPPVVAGVAVICVYESEGCAF